MTETSKKETKGEPRPSADPRVRFAVMDYEFYPNEEVPFEEPYRILFSDGLQVETFTTDERRVLPDHVLGIRHMLPGIGCTDMFFAWLFGRLSPRYLMETNESLRDEKVEMRYEKVPIFVHQGGRLGFLFLLQWLKGHKKEYEVEIDASSSSSKMLRLHVFKLGEPKRWLFVHEDFDLAAYERDLPGELHIALLWALKAKTALRRLGY